MATEIVTNTPRVTERDAPPPTSVELASNVGQYSQTDHPRTFLQITAARVRKEPPRLSPYARQPPPSMPKISATVKQLIAHLRTTISTSFPKPQWLPQSLANSKSSLPTFTINFDKTPVSPITYDSPMSIISAILGDEVSRLAIARVGFRGKHLEIYTNAAVGGPNCITLQALILKIQNNVELFLQHEPIEGASKAKINRLEATHYTVVVVKGVPPIWGPLNTARVLFQTLRFPTQGLVQAPFVNDERYQPSSLMVHLIYEKPPAYFVALATCDDFELEVGDTKLTWDYGKPPKGYRKWCSKCHNPHPPIMCPIPLTPPPTTSPTNTTPDIPPVEEDYAKFTVVRRNKFDWKSKHTVGKPHPTRSNRAPETLRPARSRERPGNLDRRESESQHSSTTDRTVSSILTMDSGLANPRLAERVSPREITSHPERGDSVASPVRLARNLITSELMVGRGISSRTQSLDLCYAPHAPSTTQMIRVLLSPVAGNSASNPPVTRQLSSTPLIDPQKSPRLPKEVLDPLGPIHQERATRTWRPIVSLSDEPSPANSPDIIVIDPTLPEDSNIGVDPQATPNITNACSEETYGIESIRTTSMESSPAVCEVGIPLGTGSLPVPLSTVGHLSPTIIPLDISPNNRAANPDYAEGMDHVAETSSREIILSQLPEDLYECDTIDTIVIDNSTPQQITITNDPPTCPSPGRAGHQRESRPTIPFEPSRTVNSYTMGTLGTPSTNSRSVIERRTPTPTRTIPRQTSIIELLTNISPRGSQVDTAKTPTKVTTPPLKATITDHHRSTRKTPSTKKSGKDRVHSSRTRSRMPRSETTDIPRGETTPNHEQ